VVPLLGHDRPRSNRARLWHREVFRVASLLSGRSIAESRRGGHQGNTLQDENRCGTARIPDAGIAILAVLFFWWLQARTPMGEPDG